MEHVECYFGYGNLILVSITLFCLFTLCLRQLYEIGPWIKVHINAKFNGAA